MGDNLLNWNPDKGDPFQTPKYNYEYEDPSWRILSDQASTVIDNIHLMPEFKFHRIYFPVTYYLWMISKIVDFDCLELLVGIHGRNSLKDINCTTHLDEVAEEVSLDPKKPISVFTSYPFHSKIEISIFPFKYVLETSNGKKVSSGGFHIGYILWQISRQYATIYKHHSRKVGIWGHQFSDLAFGRIDILRNNQLMLDLES